MELDVHDIFRVLYFQCVSRDLDLPGVCGGGGEGGKDWLEAHLCL